MHSCTYSYKLSSAKEKEESTITVDRKETFKIILCVLITFTFSIEHIEYIIYLEFAAGGLRLVLALIDIYLLLVQPILKS